MQSFLPSTLRRNGGSSRKAGKKAPQTSALMIYLAVFGVCGYLLLVALSEIYIEQCIEALGDEWVAEKKKLEIVEKEQENLEFERQKLMTGAYILPHARRLGLRQPLPGQVRKMPPIDMRKPRKSAVAIRNP